MQGAAAANKTLNKASILALYRRCIRSAQKIPDANHRASYLLYVKDGFRRRAHVPSDSRDALLAYRDGMEQVERMEYYQSQLKTKKQEKCPTRFDTPKNEASNSASSDNNDTSDHLPIEKWLRHHLPHLSNEDMKAYSRQLADDGFDSVEFIEEELLEEDLSFMKKAHRRVVARQLKLR